MARYEASGAREVVGASAPAGRGWLRRLVASTRWGPLAVAVVAGSLAMGPLTAEPSDAASSVAWLRTSGNEIVSARTGTPVVLHGANIMRSDWTRGFSTAWERKAIPRIARWGGNVVVRGFASKPVNNGNQRYLDMLDRYVALARANNMYVIFVWRSHAPDGPQPNTPDASARAALPRLAARYRGNPTVMYGLQVEPHGRGSSWAELRPTFEAMVDRIRKASAPYEPIVMVPGSSWSNDVSGAVAHPVRRRNIVYKAHGYENRSEFRAMFGAAHRAGLPVFVGEFAPTDGATTTDTKALISYTRRHGIGWAAWWMDYDNPGTESLVRSATNLAPTRPWGTMVRRAM